MLLVEFQVDERGLKKRHNQCAQQMTARPSPKKQQEMLHNNMYDVYQGVIIFMRLLLLLFVKFSDKWKPGVGFSKCSENIDPKGQEALECVR